MRRNKWYGNIYEENYNNYELRKSLIGGIYGCLVVKAKVTIIGTTRSKSTIVYASACSRDLTKRRENIIKKVSESAKIQGFSKIKGLDIEDTSGKTNIYVEALNNSNMVVQFLDYRFRYFTRRIKTKTINRGGKRYNYVFKNNGRIKTYSRMRYFQNIQNYRQT